ncbi:MBL fold metallo-hydrolase [Schaalia sp. 19OD2882]|uniref:MBL fold metallo-hydrolase n=1 Tax=Schaalia sp. 19OD2882 TaxID=2794089 RepID=UPI001C1E978C|nr:MBL fold metallo-hydrolase [Schaalia sp. 19OD2882]QWW18972.1 MBL fold metallo-hydrolase [Schaalia sp. 19OD2882]
MYTIERRVLGSWKAVCYAITNDEGTLVIDPGAQAEEVLEWLEGKNVVGVVITHCHCDHIGAVNEVVEAHGCWVACGVDDVDGVADLHRSGFDDEGIDYTVDHIDRPLAEGDEIRWGADALKVLHTPGHTPGSICLLDEARGILFTGDMLFAGAIGSTQYVLGNDRDMRCSCARLAQMDPALVVLPGHGRETTLGAEAAMLRMVSAVSFGESDQSNCREGSWW